MWALGVYFASLCTPAVRYSPPEFVRESTQADVYAFGMTLLEIVTKAVPYAEVSSEREVVALAHEVCSCWTQLLRACVYFCGSCCVF